MVFGTLRAWVRDEGSTPVVKPLGSVEPLGFATSCEIVGTLRHMWMSGRIASKLHMCLIHM